MPYFEQVFVTAIGGKSNTGEGGEDKDRLYDPERRSYLAVLRLHHAPTVFALLPR
jgi:hypothetical protein